MRSASTTRSAIFLAALLAGVAAFFLLRSANPASRAELDESGLVTVEASRSPFADRYTRATELIAAGETSQAESIYQSLASKEPRSPNPHIGIGACRMKSSDFEGALEAYEVAIDINPATKAAFIGAGSAHFSLGNSEEAIEAYETVLKIDAQQPEAHWGLAIVYAEQGNHEKASLHLEQFKKIAPGSRHISKLEQRVNSQQPPNKSEQGDRVKC